jgi:hypothetical protein
MAALRIIPGCIHAGFGPRRPGKGPRFGVYQDDAECATKPHVYDGRVIPEGAVSLCANEA